MPSKPILPSGTLRKRALRGSAFELGGYGLSSVLRLGGNIVLSRLLFPEAFGLSAEVALVMNGLIMLSDVGIRQCVIRSPRGDDATFLNTAFTMQVIRGLVLTILGLAAATPVAHFWFREPALTGPLLVASFQQLILGFHSTAEYTLRRHLRLGVVNGLDLAKQVIGLTVTVIWARAHPSVWALIGGNLAGVAFSAGASHFLPVGYRNRFRWEVAAYKELSVFGRWIMGSSSITFFANQGDRALFGRLLGAAQLGVYQVASELPAAAANIVERLVGGILYPVLSAKGLDGDRKELRLLYYKIRLPIDIIAQGGLGLLCGGGVWLVHLLWDPRWWAAAWMLPFLCVRVATSCLIQPTETCMVSMGLPRYGFLRSLLRGVTVWIAIPLGFWFAGVRGLVWAVALCELPTLLLLWPAFWRLSVLRIERELLAILIFLTAFGLGTLALNVLPNWHLPHRH
jgi:O-antigen/teichoic acid export membrane protein